MGTTAQNAGPLMCIVYSGLFRSMNLPSPTPVGRSGRSTANPFGFLRIVAVVAFPITRKGTRQAGFGTQLTNLERTRNEQVTGSNPVVGSGPAPRMPPAFGALLYRVR